MSDLFDKNGNATKTHIATVSGFDALTGEHISTYDVRIFEGTGIPGFSTMTLAPAFDVGHVVCWDGLEWQQVIDLRGATAYEKATAEAVSIKSLGPLSDELTVLEPSTAFDKWDGECWVTDKDAQNGAALTAAQLMRSTLLSVASTEIAWRQDAVDAEIGTDEEKTELAAWKKYRVLLNRVDTSTAPTIEWPLSPGA